MRRVPPALLAGAAGLLGGGLLMIPAIDSAALADRVAAVVARERASETQKLPRTATLPRGAAIAARDPGTAATMLRQRLRSDATRGGLLVERSAILPAPGGDTVAIDLAVSGTEKAVLAFADTLARARPVAAFYDWRIEAIDQSSVRLSGSVVAPWR